MNSKKRYGAYSHPRASIKSGTQARAPMLSANLQTAHVLTILTHHLSLVLKSKACASLPHLILVLKPTHVLTASSDLRSSARSHVASPYSRPRHFTKYSKLCTLFSPTPAMMQRKGWPGGSRAWQRVRMRWDGLDRAMEFKRAPAMTLQ
eukprot:1139227-Pelagomonas_calceolata.AAC.3